MDVRCDYTASGLAVAGLGVELGRVKSRIQVIGKEKDEYERRLPMRMDEESRALAEQATAHEQALTQQQQDYEAKIKTLQAQLANQDDKAQASQRQRLNLNTQAATQHISVRRSANPYFN